MMTLVVRLPRAPEVRRDLTGPVVAGGSHADDLHLPGCPAAALRLVPCAAGVIVEAGAAGVHAARHPVSAGSRRLVRPGEELSLRGTRVAVEAAAAPDETRAAAAALLRAAAAGSGVPAGLHLVVLTGPAAGARHPLGPVETLGRGRRASIVVADPAASRVHARLTVGPDGARLEDLRSKNGVSVNGVRVDRGPLPVRTGDELTVGETVLALADGAPAPPPQPARPRRGRGHLAAATLLALSAAALALAAG